jgi:hypothetical protein
MQIYREWWIVVFAGSFDETGAKMCFFDGEFVVESW